MYIIVARRIIFQTGVTEGKHIGRITSRTICLKIYGL